uniref:Uncharacterized protein n=1 Tax=Opuntia streptacantha TaxID=393608 RepID=A0A7C9CZ05_OPUST
MKKLFCVETGAMIAYVGSCSVLLLMPRILNNHAITGVKHSWRWSLMLSVEVGLIVAGVSSILTVLIDTDGGRKRKFVHGCGYIATLSFLFAVVLLLGLLLF